jgi:hypothetical protein
LGRTVVPLVGTEAPREELQLQVQFIPKAHRSILL